MTRSETDNKPRGLLSRAERHAAGKALRAHISRQSHADYEVTSDRDPVAILAESDESRIPELLSIRYERMAVSPFTFLRGAAAVMANDLAPMPRLGLTVQACGDCHLMNFGAFNTPEGKVLFDINDFDETLSGIDFTVDLKRLVASVAVAALDAGMADSKAKTMAKNAAEAYRLFMAELAAMTPMQIWHVAMDIEREAQRIDNSKLRKKILATLMKAEKDPTADDNFPHLASTKGGAPHIEDRPPLIYHFSPEADARHTIDAQAAFAAYARTLTPERRILLERYELADIAFKVVGVGSVGTFCAIGLFVTPDQDHFFLQIKEAQQSVLEAIAPPPKPLAQQGQRVVEGQRIMQAASDLFLGWTQDEKAKRQFYVRQLKNRHLGGIGEVVEVNALSAYANICARTLARAHARSGDPAGMAGYMGKSSEFDDALSCFAMKYAEQTKLDHGRLIAKTPPVKSKAKKAAAKA